MLYNIMPENLYPQLPTASSMSQESFNIEMVRKHYQDIANLKEKYTEKQRKYKNAYNRLLHSSTGANTVGVVSGASTIGTAYKYALNIVDVASRYKGSYQLTTKNAKEVPQAFQWIYENTPLNYPKTLIVDDGREFCGDVTKLMEKHDVIIQRRDPSQHRSQGIVERFNRTLADRLFSYQYHKELEDLSKSNREWVSRLQNVVSALNNEKTRLIGMKPIDAIKQTLVKQGFSQPTKDYEEKLLDVGTKVRYLYEPGELEGYQYKGERRKRSTDPIWSVDVYKIKDRYIQKYQPTLYYLDGGPKRSFVFEQLQPIQDP